MKLELTEVVDNIVRDRLIECSANPGLWPTPRLYDPATRAQVESLEGQCGQALEETYKDFLYLTDGMSGFYMTMLILGCRNWESMDDTANLALRFRDELVEDMQHEDVGLAEGANLFPLSVNRDASSGVFMFTQEGVSERYWWPGEGSSLFFETFTELLHYSLDPTSCSPRHYLA
ncbi:hypothetical protein [Streptomyces sp. NPDC051183]|uniref:hypothetical protein n=1 Tax=unclassified Streptomyces TaxID=2593676 RepID=UPI0034450C17